LATISVEMSQAVMGNGQFLRPDAIALDGLWGCLGGDQNNGRVKAGAGQFSFVYPMGIATNGKGGIWVTDTNNNRVQKWSYGGKPIRLERQAVMRLAVGR
jgi:NHL repeat